MKIEETVETAIDVTPPADAESVTGTRRFFKRSDWITALATFLFSGCIFYYHMAPEVTLQDSGELVTGAFTFGVAHPPGYPIWTFLGYIWSHLIVPFGNPAWRIGTMSVFTGAATVGTLTLLMIRSTRVLLHTLSWTHDMDEKMREWITLSISIGISLLFGFNRGVWLWASVSEMRVLNAFSFMLITYMFFAWMIQPKRLWYLCASLLIYGLSMTNHQTVAVMIGALVVGTLAIGLDTFIEQRDGVSTKRTFKENTVLLMSSLTTFWNLLVAVMLVLAAVMILFAWLKMPSTVHPMLLKAWDITISPSVLSLAVWRAITLAGILGAIFFAKIPINGLRITTRQRKILSIAVIAIFIILYLAFSHDPILKWVEDIHDEQTGAIHQVIHNRVEMFAALMLVVTGLMLLVMFSEKGWVQPRYALLYTLLIAAGCAFYIYMPIAASTNPPMNWGYTSTKYGFLNTILRGQYEKLRMADPCIPYFKTQLWIFIRGLCRQYSPLLCIFGLGSLVLSTVWMVMGIVKEGVRKYRWLLFVWIAAIPVVIAGVAVLRHIFIVLPAVNQGSEEPLTPVSTVTFLLWALALPTLLCMLIGLWLYLKRLGRAWMIFVWAAFLATSLGLIMIINPKADLQEQEINIKFFAPAHGFFAMLMGYGFTITLAFIRRFWKQIPRKVILLLCAVCLAFPLVSYRNNRELCSLNKFDFGYQLGYRMFHPGGGYPDMAKDAVLFGGTDPGNFIPTYMIFCESAVKPQHRYRSKWLKDADPNYDGSAFDRSDVYIITQNSLSSAIYMNYISDHYGYNRPSVDNGTLTGTIIDKPTWQQNVFKAGWTLFDRQNIYPKEPIHLPTPNDSEKAFDQYMEEWMSGRTSPSDDLKIENGRIYFGSTRGIMEINAILAKWIFDWNKDKHDFYVEESYVIRWMYPYLRPAGVIMKIEKEPLPSPQQDPKLWQDIVAQDTVYWDDLIRGFLAREEFRRSTDAKKSFAKMRAAIAGLYQSRRMLKQAEYAFKQSIALCPESSEWYFRLAELYVNTRRFVEARDLIKNYLQFDEYNDKAIRYYKQLDDLVESGL